MHTKLVKVETIGSQKQGNLRPVISDILPSGFNHSVLEYNETEGWCILYIWCSDHEILPENQRKTKADLDDFLKHPAVIDFPSSHPLLSAKPCSLTGSFPADSLPIDIKNKKVTFQGKLVSFKSKQKIRDGRIGQDMDFFVFDEG